MEEDYANLVALVEKALALRAEAEKARVVAEESEKAARDAAETLIGAALALRRYD